MKPILINAVDIPDAWFQCISSILDNGYKYVIDRGSYEGQTRLEFEWITVVIKNAYAEPYDLMLPSIPTHLNIPNPVEAGFVEQYLSYLMTDDIKSGEQYTYGSRIAGNYSINVTQQERYFVDKINQIEYWIRALAKTPGTNQAVLQVAQPSDFLLSDPPCLRHIDMRIKDRKLIFYPYFRSWDLWGGLPANLAGIAVLQKYMADSIGVDIGPIVASSKGLHIYGYVEELAKIRANK